MARSKPRPLKSCRTPASFAYIANQRAGTVSAFQIDAATGALVPHGAVIATDNNPYSITVDAGRRSVYVTHGDASSIMAFSIDPISAELKPAPVSRTATGNYAVSAAIDPAGRFLYVSTMAADAIDVYAINPITAALSPVAGSPFPAGTRPSGSALHPSGRFLYVTNLTTRSVAALAVDRATGALKPVPGSPFPAGTNPRAIAIEPRRAVRLRRQRHVKRCF